MTYDIEITRTLGRIPIQPPPSQSSELQTPLASANLHTISDAIFFITAGERWTHWVPAPPRSPGHPKSSPPPTIPTHNIKLASSSLMQNKKPPPKSFLYIIAITNKHNSPLQAVAPSFFVVCG